MNEGLEENLMIDDPLHSISISEKKWEKAWSNIVLWLFLVASTKILHFKILNFLKIFWRTFNGYCTHYYLYYENDTKMHQLLCYMRINYKIYLQVLECALQTTDLRVPDIVTRFSNDCFTKQWLYHFTAALSGIFYKQ